MMLLAHELLLLDEQDVTLCCDDKYSTWLTQYLCIPQALGLRGSPPLILDNHHSCTVSLDTLTLGPDPDLPVPFQFSLLPIDRQLSSPFMWSFDLVLYDRPMVLITLYPPTTFAIYFQVSPLSPFFSYIILKSMNNSRSKVLSNGVRNLFLIE